MYWYFLHVERIPKRSVSVVKPTTGDQAWDSRRHLLERSHDPLDTGILPADKVVHIGLRHGQESQSIIMTSNRQSHDVVTDHERSIRNPSRITLVDGIGMDPDGRDPSKGRFGLARTGDGVGHGSRRLLLFDCGFARCRCANLKL